MGRDGPRGEDLLRGVAPSLVVASSLALALAAGCVEPPEPKPLPEPKLPPGSEVAYDASGVAIVATDARTLPIGTDLTGFPSVSGVSPRDFVYEETSGPLKGYVTKFYRIRHVLGATLVGILNNWKSAQARILDVPLHNMLIIT